MNCIKIGGAACENFSQLFSIFSNSSLINNTKVIVFSAFGKSSSLLYKASEFALSNHYSKSLDYIAELNKYYKTDDSEINMLVDFQIEEIKQILKAVAISGVSPNKILHSILSKGELLTMIMYELVLTKLNIDYKTLPQLTPIHSNFDGNIDEKCIGESLKQMQSINNNSLFLIPGFIANAPDGTFVTTGFESSNYSAAIIANGFDCNQLHFLTDVDGIFTLDPKEFKGKLLNNIDYVQAITLAQNGLKILNYDSLVYCKHNSIKINYFRIGRNHSTTISYDNSDFKFAFIVKQQSLVISYKDFEIFATVCEYLNLRNFKGFLTNDFELKVIELTFGRIDKIEINHFIQNLHDYLFEQTKST